jgi:hypothetical protein
VNAFQSADYLDPFMVPIDEQMPNLQPQLKQQLMKQTLTKQGNAHRFVFLRAFLS